MSRARRGRGGGREYHIDSLPAETQAALLVSSAPQADRPADSHSPSPSVNSSRPTRNGSGREASYTYDRQALWSYYERKPDKQKAVAAERLAALDAAMQMIDRGVQRSEAFRSAADAAGTDRATLYRWHKRARRYDRCDWLAALLPAYTGRKPDAYVSPEAWDYFRADYLRPEAPAARACYERLCRAAAEHGWEVPSLRTLERKLRREVPRQAIVLARRGTDALKQTYPAQERDRSVFHAMEAVNADGHRFDVFCRWPDGTIARPTMVAWQDLRSGKVLAWRIDQTEHSDAYRLSFGDLVEHYGIPEHAYVDNGRGIASKWLTGGIPNRYRFKVREEDPVGILTQLGVQVHWTTPYAGQSKPIERAFRDLCEYVARHPALSGAYTGNKPSAKPENYGSRAVDLAKVLAIVDQEIRAHNARTGRRSRVANGRSFDQVFAESYAEAPIRKATAEQRRLWLLAADGVKAASRDGSVTLLGNRYWSEELAEYAGQRLVVRFDPQALHDGVHIYTLDSRYIGHAECVQAAGFNDTQAAREHARRRRQNLNTAKQQLANERRMSALEASRFIPRTPEPEPVEARVARPVFGQHARGEDGEADAEVVDFPDRERGEDDRYEQHFQRVIGAAAAQLREQPDPLWEDDPEV